MIFADTSAVAKLYVPEAESAAVRQLFEKEDAVGVSELVRVELMSLFKHRLREGRWAREDFLAATRQFHQDDLSGFWTWLPLDVSVLTAAAQTYTTLPETIPLRASDCLHLVTALQHSFPAIHTYDQQQARAATALGLQAATA